jgi:hypothetical protein
MGKNMYQVQRSGRFKGSTASIIALAVEASKLHEVITGAPLAAWIASAGMPPGTFGWSSWVETLDHLATHNAQLIASDMWGKLENKAANVATDWSVDQIAQVIVTPDFIGKVAQPGSRVLQSRVRANQTADPIEMLQWATKMAEVTGRVSGGSAGLSQCGFGPDWGTYIFSQLYPDAKALDAGVARSMASAEYLSVFMEGRKYVDTSTMRRVMMVKLA